MGDFEYWFDNVVGASDLIASEDALARAWIQKDETITSAHDPDELFEQLLGDLNLEENVQRFDEKLRRLSAFEAVAKFSQALLDLERVFRNTPRLQSAERLLASPQWATVREAATCILQVPAVKTRQQESSG